jgi:predicted phosphodiesterase
MTEPRRPTCHPDRPHQARGLCKPCYDYQRAHDGQLPPTDEEQAARWELEAAEAAQEVLEQRDEALRQIRALTDHNAELRGRIELYEPAGRMPGSVYIPEWAIPGADSPLRTKTHYGTPTLLMTDLHFGERVRKEEMYLYNEYNVELSEKRLRYTTERAAVVVRRYMGGLDIDGIVVAYGGDMVTGIIHEELQDTNDERPAETVVRMAPLLAADLLALADEFGHVYVPCVSGNHDRNSLKRRHKRRAQDTWTWVLYHWVKQLVSHDPRIVVDIAEASDLVYKVYDTTYLLTHGDQFHGGSGIAGALSPLMLGNHRKSKRNAGLGQPYDVMVMGHFHQTLYLPGVIVGGCMKGYDEFASNCNFPPEPARQSLWMTTPERGITLMSSVDCDPGGWRP